MKFIKQWAITAIFFLGTTHIDAVPETSYTIDTSTGNGISAWEYYDYTIGRYVIQASILTSGTWSTPPVIISDINTDSYRPKAATSSNGVISVIWESDDPLSGNLLLCGAIYSGSWGLPTVLSTVTESVGSQEDYFVHINSSDITSVNYMSQELTTGAYQLRGIHNTTITGWATPTTIAP